MKLRISGGCRRLRGGRRPGVWSLGRAGHPARGRGPRWPGRPILSLGLARREPCSLDVSGACARSAVSGALLAIWPERGSELGARSVPVVLPHSPEEPSQVPPHIWCGAAAGSQDADALSW